MRFEAKGLGKCGAVVMYLAVLVGKIVEQDVREWCPSTSEPLLPIMTDFLLAPGQEVLYKRRACRAHHSWAFHSRR